MGNTLILDESKGRAAVTVEQQEAIKQENDSKLPEAIRTAAVKEGFESSPDLIATAKMRFMYGDGAIKPLSIYKDMTDFMKRHNHGAAKIKAVTEMVDERAMKKKSLYDELCHNAEIGDMKSYRTCRTEFALL